MSSSVIGVLCSSLISHAVYKCLIGGSIDPWEPVTAETCYPNSSKFYRTRYAYELDRIHKHTYTTQNNLNT